MKYYVEQKGTEEKSKEKPEEELLEDTWDQSAAGIYCERIKGDTPGGPCGNVSGGRQVRTSEQCADFKRLVFQYKAVRGFAE